MKTGARARARARGERQYREVNYGRSDDADAEGELAILKIHGDWNGGLAGENPVHAYPVFPHARWVIRPTHVAGFPYTRGRARATRRAKAAKLQNERGERGRENA